MRVLHRTHPQHRRHGAAEQGAREHNRGTSAEARDGGVARRHAFGDALALGCGGDVGAGDVEDRGVPLPIAAPGVDLGKIGREHVCRHVSAAGRDAQRKPGVAGGRDPRPSGEDRALPPTSFTVTVAVPRSAVGGAASTLRSDRGETSRFWAPVDRRWATLRRVDEVLVMVGCRRCGTPFFVCRKDYRGQAYCGDACRAATRFVSARAARMRHERSEAGRLDHRDRQRAYRMRLRTRVTAHASAAMPLPRTLSPPRSTPAPRAPFHARLPRCVRCGCESAWVRWAPLPRTRPRRSRRDRGREPLATMPRALLPRHRSSPEEGRASTSGKASSSGGAFRWRCRATPRGRSSGADGAMGAPRGTPSPRRR